MAIHKKQIKALFAQDQKQQLRIPSRGTTL